jgi:hypothetical protein
MKIQQKGAISQTIAGREVYIEFAFSASKQKI